MPGLQPPGVCGGTYFEGVDQQILVVEIGLISSVQQCQL